MTLTNIHVRRPFPATLDCVDWQRSPFQAPRHPCTDSHWRSLAAISFKPVARTDGFTPSLANFVMFRSIGKSSGIHLEQTSVQSLSRSQVATRAENQCANDC